MSLENELLSMAPVDMSLEQILVLQVFAADLRSEVKRLHDDYRGLVKRAERMEAALKAIASGVLPDGTGVEGRVYEFANEALADKTEGDV